MKSSYVNGTERRKDDTEISDRLKSGNAGDGGYPKRIGIRNEQGVIYRCIEARGTSQLVDILQALYGLNFRDELEHASSTHNGYHSIFSKWPLPQGADARVNVDYLIP